MAEPPGRSVPGNVHAPVFTPSGSADVTPEFTASAPEFTASAPEFTASAPEFTPRGEASSSELNPSVAEFPPVENPFAGASFEYNAQQSYGFDPSGLEQPQGAWFEAGTGFLTPPDARTHNTATSLCFDPAHELLWVGSQNGYVSSFEVNMAKYTGYKAHTSEVRQVVAANNFICSVGATSIHVGQRTGLSQVHIESDDLRDLQCALFASNDETRLLVGGAQPTIVLYDLQKNRAMKTAPAESTGLAVLRRGRATICGTMEGKVQIRDPTSLKVEHVLDAHTGAVSDIALAGNTLVTCGLASRGSNYAMDSMLKCYDLRMFRAMTPLSFHYGPYFLKTHPLFSGSVVVASQNGHFTFVDVRTDMSPNPDMFMVDTGGTSLVCMDVSASGETIAFGDGAGVIHQWTDRDTCHVNQYSAPLPCERPAGIPEPTRRLNETDNLNSIGLPLHAPNTQLLSTWPPEATTTVGKPSYVIDPAWMEKIRYSDFIGYLPNQGGRKRNQRYTMAELIESNRRLTGTEKPFTSPSPQKKNNPINQTPKHYRFVEIQNSRLEETLGMFDNQPYNMTKLGSLENGIPNAYCNAVLQATYFMPAVRKYILGHLCRETFCVSCELSFLYHMLDMGRGKNVQAANFHRTFKQMRLAGALGLLEAEEPADTTADQYAKLIETFNRFILEQLNQDCVSNPNASWRAPPFIDLVFGASIETSLTCIGCREKTIRVNRAFIVDFIYPRSGTPQTVKFSEALQRSLTVARTTKAWCDSCKSYQPVKKIKAMRTLPNILSINCAPDTVAERDYWKTDVPLKKTDDGADPDASFLSRVTESKEPWLPLALRVQLTEGGVEVSEDVDEDEPIFPSHDADIYDLTAVICNIRDKPGDRTSHIVCEIKVAQEYHDLHESTPSHHSDWFLFNDFVITPLSKHEVVYMNPAWKTPCVLYYTKRHQDARFQLQNQPPSPITSEVLFDLSPLQEKRARRGLRPINPPSRLLSKAEIPQAGDLVALDAEFVAITNIEESEITQDGVRLYVKPGRMALARVSCVGGTGQLFGRPFIDDYIATPEPVSDYLTRFSGLSPGDLDPIISSHHVTTLKHNYLKLRYLVDNGIILVGHGLKKDFRMINLVVPKNQVIDTVDLFHLKGQRRLGLAFLMGYLFGKRIQEVTHDSIEDARAALDVYLMYKKLNELGEFRGVLHTIYRVGRKCGFKVQEGMPTLDPAILGGKKMVAKKPG